MTQGHDQLHNSRDEPVRSRLSSVGSAGLLLALGAGLGLSAQAGLEQSLGSAPAAPDLTVGAIETNGPRPSWANYVVPLRNDGESAVQVLSVAPAGWTTYSRAVTVEPGTWTRVPIHLHQQCEATPPMGREVVVRTGDDERLRLELPGPPLALITEQARRCEAGDGTVPSRRQLLGTWHIDRGSAFAGQMLIRFTRDGGYTLNSELGRFGWSPGTTGVFTLQDGVLTLRSRSSGECQRGDRSVWRVTLVEGGRLHIRWLEQYDSWCRVSHGDVWEARRLRPPYPDTLTLR